MLHLHLVVSSRNEAHQRRLQRLTRNLITYLITSMSTFHLAAPTGSPLTHSTGAKTVLLRRNKELVARLDPAVQYRSAKFINLSCHC